MADGDLSCPAARPCTRNRTTAATSRTPVYDDAPDGKGMRFAARARMLATDGRVERTPVVDDGRAARARRLLAVAVETSFAGFDREPSRGPRPGPGDAGTAGRGRGPIVRAPPGGARPRLPRAVRPRRRSTSADRRRTATPTDRRLRDYAAGAADPGLEALYFQFGRYLLISGSRPGGPPAQPAGHLEPAPAAAVEQQLHRQHQHRDELLARRDHEPRRVPRTAAALHRRPGQDRRGHGPPLLRLRRLVRPPQQRHLGAQQPGRRLRAGQPGLGELADGRRLAQPASLGALRLRRRPAWLRDDRLPADEGRGGVRAGLARRRAGRIPRDGAVDLAGEPVQDARRLRRAPSRS